MFVELRQRYGSSYQNARVLPIFKGLVFDQRHNDVGSFQVSLRVADTSAYGIGDLSIFEVCPNGKTGLPNMWFTIDSTSPAYIVDDEQWVTLSGRSAVALLEEAIIYPSAYPSATPPNHDFVDATPGFIMRTFIDRAKQRGALKNADGSDLIDASSFTGPADSNNTAWASNQTITYQSGNTALQTLQDLASRQLLSFSMIGLSLYLYNYDTNVTFYTADQRLFFSGRDIVEQTITTDSKNWRSAVLVLGDANHVVEVTNSTTQAAIGRRRESFLAQGSISDTPTLGLLGNQQLALTGHLSTEETLSVRDDTVWIPFIDYSAGDWIWRDREGTQANLQLQQIAASQQDSGHYQIAFTLGDIIASQAIRIQRIMDAITGANGELGSLPNPSSTDYVAPGPPPSAAVVATPYLDNNGLASGQATITWGIITLNADGSTCTDLQSYAVQYALVNPAPNTDPDPSTLTYTDVASVDASATRAAYISSLPIGARIFARVRGVDQAGNTGAWVYSTGVTTPNMAATINAPSIPIITPGASILRVYWDGRDNTNSVYPPKFAHIEVHRSTTVNFTPSTSTLVDSLVAAGYHISTNLSYTTTYYYKFVAVSQQNAVSPASLQASGIPNRVSSTDIGSVDAATIISNSVISDVIVGGRVKTADTGARVELNAAGLQQYNSSNVLTVSIDTSGSALITGQFRSALQGHRIELNSPSVGGNSYTMRFLTGTNGPSNNELFTQIQQYNLSINDPISGNYYVGETFTMNFNGNTTDGYTGRLTAQKTTSGNFLQLQSISNLYIRAGDDGEIGPSSGVASGAGDVNMYSANGRVYVRSTSTTNPFVTLRGQLDGNFSFDNSTLSGVARNRDSDIGVYKGILNLRAGTGVTDNSKGGTIFINAFGGSDDNSISGVISIQIQRGLNLGDYVNDTYLLIEPTQFLMATSVVGGGNSGVVTYFWTMAARSIGKYKNTGPGGDGFIVYPDSAAFANGRFVIRASRTIYHGPGIQMISNSGYGGGFDFYDNNGQAGMSIEALYVDNSFAPVAGYSFTNLSTITTKNNILELGSALDHVKDTRIVQYTRNDGTKDRQRRSLERGNTWTFRDDIKPVVYTGIIAEEAPQHLRRDTSAGEGTGVDIYAMASTLWKAVQELTAKVEELESKL